MRSFVNLVLVVCLSFLMVAQERFPGCQGLCLWNIIEKHYVANNDHVTPWFGPTGAKNLVRSTVNNRDEASSRDAYKDSTL